MRKPTIKTLRKKLKKVCHEYIRKRDCQSIIMGGNDGRCCTCGKPLKWNDPAANAGHYVSVGTATQGTEYDERNIHLQCVYCNNWGEGKKPEYTLFLIEKYGDGIIEELVKQSKWSIAEFAQLLKVGRPPTEIFMTGVEAYQWLITYYTKKLQEL
jgi:Bacteriophage Lambda NinG protein